MMKEGTEDRGDELSFLQVNGKRDGLRDEQGGVGVGGGTSHVFVRTIGVCL
jgi:hypothetical protein